MAWPFWVRVKKLNRQKLRWTKSLLVHPSSLWHFSNPPQPGKALCSEPLELNKSFCTSENRPFSSRICWCFYLAQLRDNVSGTHQMRRMTCSCCLPGSNVCSKQEMLPGRETSLCYRQCSRSGQARHSSALWWVTGAWPPRRGPIKSTLCMQSEQILHISRLDFTITLIPSLLF